MKTLFTIFLTVCLFSAIAQVTPKSKGSKTNQDDLYYSPANTDKPGKMGANGDLSTWSKMADKSVADHIITCLDNYHKERKAAFYVGIGGAAIVGASFAVDKDTANLLYVIGGMLEIGSIGMFIHAERLISRKYLTFKGNGVALRF